MLPYSDNRLGKIVFAVFFLIIIVYAYYEARGMLYGPVINTSSGATVSHERFITIKGTADRISSLFMNGKAITVTENGAFEEPYLLSDGYNRIILRAQDKYGRSSDKVLEIIYEPSVEIAPASSTPSY